MATQRGDSTQTPGGSPNDDPSTFEQSTLNGTTTTGNARLIVRDATQIDVIDTPNWFTSNTVESVLAELAASLDVVENEGATTWGNLVGTLSAQTDLQTELDLKETVANVSSHTTDTANPHSVSQTQVGLSNVDNTSDVNKPVSIAQAAYINTLHANRNVIINGNFDVWQRGTSFPAILTGKFSADRYFYGKTGSMIHTVSQSTDVPTYVQSGVKSNYSLLADVTTADTSVAAGDHTYIKYSVEGYDYARIVGGDATLSFWVKGAKTGIHCVSFRNDGVDRSYIAEYTITTADTWEKKTITIPLTETGGTWDYINGKGLDIIFTLVAGTTRQTTKDTWQTGNYLGTSSQVNEVDNVANNFLIAQVQFERGDVATPLEYKSIADELRRCQRYYQELEGNLSLYLIRSDLFTSKRFYAPRTVAMRGSPLEVFTLNQGTPNVEGNETMWGLFVNDATAASEQVITSATAEAEL